MAIAVSGGGIIILDGFIECGMTGMALVVTTGLTGESKDCNVFLPSMMRPSGNVKEGRLGYDGSDDVPVVAFVLILVVVVVVANVDVVMVVAVAVEVDGGMVVVFESIIVPVVVVVSSVVCCCCLTERSIFW